MIYFYSNKSFILAVTLTVILIVILLISSFYIIKRVVFYKNERQINKNSLLKEVSLQKSNLSFLESKRLSFKSYSYSYVKKDDVNFFFFYIDLFDELYFKNDIVAFLKNQDIYIEKSCFILVNSKKQIINNLDYLSRNISFFNIDLKSKKLSFKYEKDLKNNKVLAYELSKLLLLILD